MMSRHKQGQDSEGRPSRLGFLLSLFAFLPYFLLPLTYYVHLTASSLPAASGDLKTAALIIASQTGEPTLPHDSNACPICRGASSFEDSEVSLAIHAPDSSALLGPLSERDISSGIAQANGLALQSRAPPVMPLPQTTA